MDPNKTSGSNNPAQPTWSPSPSAVRGSEPTPTPVMEASPVAPPPVVPPIGEPVQTPTWTPPPTASPAPPVEPAFPAATPLSTTTATSWPPPVSSTIPPFAGGFGGSEPAQTFAPAVMPSSVEPQFSPIPTFTPFQTPTPAPPFPVAPVEAVGGNSFVPSPAPPWMGTSEADVSSAPTDLSSLIDNSTTPALESEVKPEAAETVSAETIVAPAPVSNPVNVTEGHKGFPKILMIVAAVVLLLVVGAVAYFFVFAPSQQKNTSLPAEQTQQPLTNPPKQAEAPGSAPVQSAPASPSAATFGNLAGSTSSAQPAATSSASAIELLRQRQAAGR